MIITHVIGGLGNQMFQYAIGRAVSISKNVPLMLDTRDFEGYSLHNGFELDRIFNINAPLAANGDLHDVLKWRAFKPVKRLLIRKPFLKLRGSHFILEPQLTYWPQITLVPDPCYLMGYWQTEKYFKSIANTIRQDFSYKAPLSGRNEEIATRIRNSNAVSLHVRRGDIAANPAVLAVHGLCSLEYYRQAVEYVAARVDRPEFFIFSDDAPWVRENLAITHPCNYVDNNKGSDSYIDMRLMSLCRHHIIANSSFSWWGAWLNPREDKIVVAPERWFAAALDSSDIVPPSWVKI